MRLNRILVKFLGTALLAASFGSISLPASAGFYLLEEVKPMWAKVDLNGDGYVTKDELCAEDPGLASGFKRADYNHDGRLDLREFEVLLISL